MNQLINCNECKVGTEYFFNHSFSPNYLFIYQFTNLGVFTVPQFYFLVLYYIICLCIQNQFYYPAGP